MGKKMLIDAAHREETRVAIISGNRVENFDFESEAKRPLRGNIYLAKVTRVEPSLQAAFVDYGGNRHGFLAFSEIHPDYYQIPVADREKLLAEEAEQQRAADQDEDLIDDVGDYADGDTAEDATDTLPAPSIAADAAPTETVSAAPTALSDVDGDEGEDAGIGDAPEAEIEEIEDDDAAEDVTVSDDDAPQGIADDDSGAETGDDTDSANQSDGDTAASPASDTLQSAAGDSEAPRRAEGSGHNGNGAEAGDERRARRYPSRRYKIQEVIKRRQIMLVQVVKEERGNKGAALTTYLSLAGRYCVAMPNTSRGGGISRKITNTADRRRLKEAMSEMNVADSMGLIVRTAGASRTKAEIKRDFDYLLRLWDNIRDLTLKSIAPALIYEEGDLIKRSIRDQYSKDIDEIIVDGDAAYKDAKDFMRMLMPSHAKNVKRYKAREPLLQHYRVQGELDSLLEPRVTLKSGGYIIINPTEALVSIDVNSGKSTKEHNIEATAVSTNLEAAEEIARQLRLRDMAGLIVIDFIDMDETRNNRAVERKLKDSLRQDRARLQVGRISSFGLLEMSRQRMRSGVLEGSTEICPHCNGTGMVRSIESAALQILRAIEAEALKSKAKALDVRVPGDVALFILNQKRTALLDMEIRCRVSIFLLADSTLVAPDYTIKSTDARTPDHTAGSDALSMVSAFDDDEDAEEATDAADDDDALTDADGDEPAEAAIRADETDDDAPPKRKRRRRRGGRKAGDAPEASAELSAETPAETPEDSDTDAADAATGTQPDDPQESPANAGSEEDDDAAPRKRRRRGRRGGRRHRRTSSEKTTESENTTELPEAAPPLEGADTAAIPAIADQHHEEAPVLIGYTSSAGGTYAPDPAPAPLDHATASASDLPTATVERPQDPVSELAPEPAPEPTFETVSPEPHPAPDVTTGAPETGAPETGAPETGAPETGEPPKRGWWQRRFTS